MSINQFTREFGTLLERIFGTNYAENHSVNALYRMLNIDVISRETFRNIVTQGHVPKRSTQTALKAHLQAHITAANTITFQEDEALSIEVFHLISGDLSVSLTDKLTSNCFGCGSFLTTNQAARFSTGRAYFSK